ncbi:hypothetical protein TSUD_145680, partial [Trifolium subterraneum]
IDLLSDVVPGRTAWRFRVRVARLWEVTGYLRSDQVVSVEMVLVDSKGVRIHATVRKQLLYLFQRKLDEGVVYNMSFFTVLPSTGVYRSTLHPYKLVFQMKTRLELAEGPEISRYGFSLTTIAEVCAKPPDYDYLIDEVSIQNVINTTRVLVEPKIAEAISFRDDLAVHGVEANIRVNVLGPRVRPSMEEDFLHTYHVMYRVKLRVTDGTGDAVFVVFDGDMQYLLGEQCATLVSNASADSVGAYPAEVLRLEGSKLLFKVARVNSAGLLSDCSFRVKRVCSDPDILKCFDALGSKDVVSAVVVEPDSMCEDQLSGGYPSLSESGVDEFVSGLLVSPAESSADQVGLSGPVSLDKTPVRSSTVGVGADDVDDVTPISVLVPKLVVKSSRKSKRDLTTAFVESVESGCGSSSKANRVE